MHRSNSIDSQPTVAIIGGGLSGALAAAQILRRAGRALGVVIFEPRAELGRGIAYSTDSPSHLLNVVAGKMSADPEQPTHFVEWLRGRGLPDDPDSFAERRHYGEYIGDVLGEALRQAVPGARLDHIRAEAERIELSAPGYRIYSRGDVFDADAVVLATGNNPPAEVRSGAGSVSGWSRDALAGLAPDDEVLLIGAGLTAIDAVLSLDDRGHRGAIHVVARHGLWPRVHHLSPAASPPLIGGAPTARTVLRMLREHASTHIGAGGTWQGAFDSVRAQTNSIWQSLPAHERGRFLRHAKTFWEIHRHRMAPQIARRLEAIVSRGQLQLHAGRMTSATAQFEGSTKVILRSRYDGREIELKVDRMISCTGPSDFAAGAPPLCADLVRQGLARLGSHNLGLEVAPQYTVVAADGQPASNLFALGPIVKGSLWETTAAPEIRVQAREVALAVLKRLAEAPAAAHRITSE